MHPDLERLIKLQELDNGAESARRRIAEIPARVEALQARLADRERAPVDCRARLADNQTARRNIEKDLAAVQSRLSKYKDQLMQVKTNKEYQAMQHEIATAEREVRGFEDQVLERMLEADELTAAVKAAEADLGSEKVAIQAEETALAQERAGLEREIERTAQSRASLAREIRAEALALFDFVARGRKGVAVTEARGGSCSVCHVRLRPQVFNEVRTNDSIIQCESCQRILYFVPASTGLPNPPARSEPC
jgi:predicted  nucleic acid-binding Zn-ribbon protein